jgi:phosphopantothenoylcysteine decarboxylase / phosphopantothenate---cysteine ligase
VNIVLGVSGSVAAYRAADLARELMRAGATVRVCLTDAAQKFVSPALFEALTGQPCVVDVFEEPERGRMAHIDWARQAEAVVVAPASANVLNKLAHGVADDMLTTIALATTRQMVVAPAMNPSMYESEMVRESMERLASLAAIVVPPAEGDVACGERGEGKLASIERIVDAVLAVARRTTQLTDRHVLITSGPTQEPIDDVRYITNRSSGKMGAALARAALLMGAQVTVVSGPAAAPLPSQAEVVRVQTAQEMLEAALQHLPKADLVLGVAAVADYRPAQRVSGKMRRGPESMWLDLLPNPDVIAELARAAPHKTVVGFAAEPDDALEVAREKLRKKNLHAIAVNDVSRRDVGFESDRNELQLLFADGQIQRIAGGKLQCAIEMLDSLAPRLVRA